MCLRFPEHLKADKELQFPNATLGCPSVTKTQQLKKEWWSSDSSLFFKTTPQVSSQREGPTACFWCWENVGPAGHRRAKFKPKSLKASKWRGLACCRLCSGSELGLHLAGIMYRSDKERKKTYNTYDGDMVLSLVKILCQHQFFFFKWKEPNWSSYC